MMSKKKKEKTDEPTKTKTKSSSRKASEDAIAIDGAPAAAMGSPAPSKLRSASGGKKAAAAVGFSNHDVALRAYYIAERRRKLDLPGDEMGDWVEAERELRQEARKKSA
jgi:hypothetical protein